MGTGVMVSRGKEEADGRVVLTGTFAAPGGSEVPYRMITVPTGPDSYTFEMYMANPPSGEMERVMEAKYTRKKP
jgi:hypothetical protein